MTIKDWIFLIIPILFNGIIIFLLQKRFEKKQFLLAEKSKYISTMQQKVDIALESFIKVVQMTGNDSLQISLLNKFIESYTNIFYYYQQNITLFKYLEKQMDELVETHERIIKTQDDLNNKNNLETQLEPLFVKIYDLLQSIQNECINNKV